jgi:uncharacterized protein YifE (UPF0438 family)
MNQTQVELLMELFEDSDYSRYPALQDLDKGTMLAIGVMLSKNGVEFTTESLLRAGLAFYSYSMDERELANSEDQHFMDLCDDRRLDAFVIRAIQQDRAHRILYAFRKHGWYTVNLHQRQLDDVQLPADANQGFYIFTDEAIQK